MPKNQPTNQPTHQDLALINLRCALKPTNQPTNQPINLDILLACCLLNQSFQFYES